MDSTQAFMGIAIEESTLGQSLRGNDTWREEEVKPWEGKLWIVNATTFVINLFIAFSSGTGWYGKTNSAISNANPTLITPATYAFSIWGVIFLLEGALVVYQCLPANRLRFALVRGVGVWFTATNLFQTAWTFAFAQEQYILSAILLVSIAVSLALALRGLAPFRAQADGVASQAHISILTVPLGLHGGWTCAAALVNVSLAADATGGASMTTQLALALLSLFVSLNVAALLTVRWGSGAYGVAVVWALLAIQQKQAYRVAQLGAVTAAALDATIVVLSVGLALVMVAEWAVSGWRLRNRWQSARNNSN